MKIVCILLSITFGLTGTAFIFPIIARMFAFLLSLAIAFGISVWEGRSMERVVASMERGGGFSEPMLVFGYIFAFFPSIYILFSGSIFVYSVLVAVFKLPHPPRQDSGSR